jgi:hypothetical protein
MSVNTLRFLRLCVAIGGGYYDKMAGDSVAAYSLR